MARNRASIIWSIADVVGVVVVVGENRRRFEYKTETSVYAFWAASILKSALEQTTEGSVWFWSMVGWIIELVIDYVGNAPIERTLSKIVGSEQYSPVISLK